LEDYRKYYKTAEDEEEKADWKIEIALLVAELYKGKALQDQLEADKKAEEALIAK